MDVLRLFVSVPVASFRVSQAREYWESYPCPPPSTVYGMLLSLVGEANRLVHQGTEIAIALLSRPKRSVVLRTLWRIKNSKVAQGVGVNKRPDFQELLIGVCLSIWVRVGGDVGEPPLIARLGRALRDPTSVKRFGGLSLGESTHLVDEVRLWRSDDPSYGSLLVFDEKGDLSLPIWPDHVGSKGTRWGQFRIERSSVLNDYLDPRAWIRICAVDSIH